MRRRGVVGLIAVVVAIVASLAMTKRVHRGGQPVLLAMQLREPSKYEGPKVEPPPPLPPPVGFPSPDPTMPVPQPGIETVEVKVISDIDPMTAVDSFLARNRQEADDSIKALTREAEMLRARLQKVEAALARWEAVAGALNQGANGAAAVPGSRVRWRLPEPQPPTAAPDPSMVKLPGPGDNPPSRPIEPPPIKPIDPPPAVPEPESLPIPPPR